MDTTGIGAYVREKRAEKGWTQRQLAEAAGTSSAYISQIEGGKVALPGADMRRRLAKAFGVRHVDILIAAGELTPGEVDTSRDPRSDAVRRLQPVIDSIQWSDGVYRIAERQLEAIRDLQRDMAKAPRMLTEMEDTGGIRVTEFGEDEG